MKDLGVEGVEAVITEGGVNALATICRARCRPGTTLVTTDPTSNGRASSRASRARRWSRSRSTIRQPTTS